jgi:pimeloyl-ACP methyl ester carboxylesterase
MAQIITVDPLFERLPARERKFKEVVVFVHHYGGHKFSFKRHMEWVNELGFDVITFDLPARTIKDLRSQFPLNKEWRFGLRHLWADKIEEVLGSLAETKILYTFSYASMAALMAIERRHTIDVKAWVCDGGPFKQILRGFENLVREGGLMEKQPRFLNYPIVRNQIVKLLGVSSGFRSYDADADRALRSLPTGFPVMSVRCEKDVLVSPDMIDDFFAAGFGRIDLQRLTLHHAGHLLGFKDEGDLYREGVGTFLRARGTAI